MLQAFTLSLLTLFFCATPGIAVRYEAQEVFRVPFGAERGALGTAVENGNFSYPKDFTLDASGRCYIFDTKKHRIARYAADGRFQISFAYPATAQQVFAHPDSKENLWLLISDPQRGTYYGVYDANGKRLRDGLFAQYDRFRMYLDDDSVLHILLSNHTNPTASANFIFHEPSLLMKKVNVAPPSETHHELRKNDHTYYIDALPGSTENGAPAIQRITDGARHPVAQIRGDVIYITYAGEIVTRTADCHLLIYTPDGALESGFDLPGLPSACHSVRFDTEGNIYELDGIPNGRGEYTPAMKGMRLIRWQRQ